MISSAEQVREGPPDAGLIRRIAIMLLAVGIYGCVSALAVGRPWKHADMTVVVLQYVVLLPAVLYGIRAGAVRADSR